MKVTTRKVWHGIYRTTDDRFEVRRSDAGGWDLFEMSLDGDGMKAYYWNSFATKSQAIAIVAEVIAEEKQGNLRGE